MKGVIGLQTIDLSGAFSKPFCEEADRVISKSKAALIIFPGQNYGRKGFYYRAFNLIYNFMRKPLIDNLIVATGTFFNFAEPEKGAVITDRLLKELPLISLEQEIPGAFNLLIDNQVGIKRVVEHLVLKHGCRRIGFIAGPVHNTEAEQRLLAWREALYDFGLTPPEGGIFRGNFIMESGNLAVSGQESFIRDNLDALVCANDYMALGAIQVLESAGLNIPGDLAITGFDDLEEARFHRLPLTTVRQPMSSIGRMAVLKALELLDKRGKITAETQTLFTDLRIRNSCGCSSAREKQIFLEKYSDVLIRRSLLDDFIRLELSPYLQDEDVRRVSGEIFHLMLEILEHSPTEELISNVLDRLEHCITVEIHVKKVELDWQEIISLIHTVSRKLSPHHLLWSHHDFFQKARIIAGEKMEQYQGMKRLRQERELTEPLRFLSRGILSADDPEQIFALLEHHLGGLGIENCHISLFEDEAIHDCLFTPCPEKSRLVYACQNGKRMALPDKGILFPTSDFIPRKYFKPSSGGRYVLYPLFFRNSLLGLLLFSLSSKGYSVNEELLQTLSAGLYHVGCHGVGEIL